MDIASEMQALYHRFGDIDGITIECQNELLAIGIENQAAKAEVFLQGAQISQYQRHNEKPLLWLSNANTFTQGTPLRGGIPICWPWFGALDKNPDEIKNQFANKKLKNMPFHGFIRERLWHVVNIETPEPNLTIIELRYEINTNQEDYWPFATTLHYKIEVGDSLTASLTTTNKSAHRFSFSQALHSYYAVSHINQTAIEGFNQSKYIDTLDNWSENYQKGNILIDEEVDRIYQADPNIEIIDAERKIQIHNKNSNSTIVWNPWTEKAKLLSNFNYNDFEKMLCIETANVLDDAITLDENEKFTLSLILQ